MRDFITFRIMLLIMLAAMLPQAASAYDFMVDGLCYKINSDRTTVSVTYQNSSSPRYTDLSGDLVIPESVTCDGTTYTVTEIGEGAFLGCAELLSATIPNTVTEINGWAFQNCTSLTSLSIPNSVTTIKYYAFYGCSSLTSVDIPNSVVTMGYSVFEGCTSLTSVTISNSLTEINRTMFAGCSSLTSVIIPNSVTKIGYKTFCNCTALTSLSIPNSVTEIENYAFEKSSLTSITIPNSVTSLGAYSFLNCRSLTSVEIGNSVTAIENCTFSGCSYLESVTIPNSVTSIKWEAFKDCYKLNVVNIPNSVTEIGDYAFYNCTNLTSLPLGKSVESIGKYSFYNCKNLSSMVIPNSVTTIGESAFESCYKLGRLTLGNSITEIGDYAFYNNSKLTLINSLITDVSTVSCSESAFRDYQSCTLYVPTGTKPAYQSTSPWSNFTTIVEGEPATPGTKFIVDGLYYQVNNDGTKVTVTYENESSPRYTDLSGNIVIPDNVAYNGTNYSVTAIGDSAFEGCAGLTSVSIPNSVEVIGDHAFNNCSGLKSINSLIMNVTDVSCSESAFNNYETCTLYVPLGKKPAYQSTSPWSNFVNISIIGGSAPVGTTFMVDGLYYQINSDGWGDGLRSVSVIYENESSPRYTNLSGDLVIPESVTYNGISYTVKAIGDSSFEGCSGLTSVTIPAWVNVIGNYAFNNCSGLTAIYSLIKEVSDVSCSESAFDNYETCTLYVPEGTYYKYHSTSPWSNFVNISIIDNSAPEGTVFMVDGLYYKVNSNRRSVTVTYETYPEEYLSQSYANLSGDLAIPERVTFDGTTYSVTDIGEYAFKNCKDLTSVVIPNSVIEIGNLAFYHCSGITSVSIGNSVTKSGTQTFDGCYSLTSVYITDLKAWCKIRFVDNVGSNPLSRAGNLYLNNVLVTDLVIPESVTSLGVFAFEGCKSFISITIPSSVTSISERAFTRCSEVSSIIIESGNKKYDSRDNCNAIIETASNRLIYGCKNTVIPNTVKAIGWDAFSGCTGLTSINIPNSVTTIGSWAFEYCTGLETVTIGNSLQWIGDYAFYHCDNLTSLDLGNSLTTIGSWAFYYTGITSLTIPNSVKNIQANAFQGCHKLKTLTLGSSITSIKGAAFDVGYNLSTIHSLIVDVKEIDCANNIFGSSNYGSCTLYVPAGTKGDYETTLPWSNFANIVEESNGDVDGDGVVTSADITVIYNIMLSGEDNPAADVDGDGHVTAGDITILYNIMLGNDK